MAELGTRFTIERVKIGHSLPKAARACALLGGRVSAAPRALANRRACLHRVLRVGGGRSPNTHRTRRWARWASASWSRRSHARHALPSSVSRAPPIPVAAWLAREELEPGRSLQLADVSPRRRYDLPIRSTAFLMEPS